MGHLVYTRKRRSSKDQLRGLANGLFSQYPEQGGEGILYRLERLSEVQGDLDLRPRLPNVRTVTRWKAEFKQLSQRVRDEYLSYRWPDAHRMELLPWEASEIGLAIRRELEPYGRRPTIRQVKWAHWLVRSAPDMPWFAADAHEMYESAETEVDRWHIMGLSELLAANEVTTSGMLYNEGIPIDQRVTFLEVVEDYLSWKPWIEKNGADKYLAESTVRSRGPMAMLRLGSFPMSDETMVELGYDPGSKPSEIGMPVMQGVHLPHGTSGRKLGFSISEKNMLKALSLDPEEDS